MDKIRVRSALAARLLSVGLPKPGETIIKVDNAWESQHVRRWLAQSVQQARPTRPAWANWAVRSVRLLVRPELCVRKRFTDITRAFRATEFTELNQLTLSDFAAAARGDDMQRIQINGRVPLLTQHTPYRDTTTLSCKRWLGSQGLDRHTYPSYRAPRKRPCPPPTPDERRYHHVTTQRHDFESRASSGPTGTCFTVEDKDPNTLWRVNSLYQLARWLQMLSHAPDRWRVVDTTIAAVLSWYRLLYDFTIPKSMRARGEGALNQGHIPYVYSTVKLKCWDGGPTVPSGGRHRCCKPQHSCFRNICSFVRLPSRVLYRSLSRALTFLANQVYPGWAFTSLDNAVPNFVAQFSQLESHPAGEACRCRGCGCLMFNPGLVVGDAGQAYEAIDLDRIYTCLDRLFDQLESEKKKNIPRSSSVSPLCALRGPMFSSVVG